jgi:ferredoxin
VEEKKSDDPYIETPRCSSCNECTLLNPKMFAYDGNKQAYIANPDAGTYRELVEAAESCQVSVIHPGKPRNPNEPGLDELLARAEPFM